MILNVFPNRVGEFCAANFSLGKMFASLHDASSEAGDWRREKANYMKGEPGKSISVKLP